MAADPYIERILGGGLLILSGLAAKSLQRATRIPDVFFLMLAGVLAGPILHIANPQNYQPLILLFTSLALAFLMFWVGSRLKIRTLLHGFSTNVFFALTAYALTLLLTFGLSRLAGLPFWSAALIAILMSDTGPTIVNSVIQTIRLTKAGQVGMVIESSVSNALGLALFLGAYRFAAQDTFNVSAVAASIAGTFAVALALGALFGLAWILFMRRAAKTETFTWLTLAGLLMLYALVEHLQAAAPIAAFVFGLMVANADAVNRHLGLSHQKLPFSFTQQDHLLFFVRTAFFIYMGLLFPLSNINANLFALVFAALAMVGVLRAALAWLWPKAFVARDVVAQAFIYPTGFSVVVLTFYPQALGFTVPFLVEGIIYAVMISNLFSAIATRLHAEPKSFLWLKAHVAQANRK